MLGFRGASRYVSESFGEAFAMECEALVRVRRDMGLTNVEVMVPFVRTLGQAERVVGMLAEQGLKRAAGGGSDGLRVIMMCEVPSNALLAEQFLEHFDGMSIGSNDLTQLTLGLDRDSGLELLARDFDERDPAVKALISRAIAACRGDRQVHRHLRPGAERPSRLRRLAGRRGHRLDLAQPRQRGRDLAAAGDAAQRSSEERARVRRRSEDQRHVQLVVVAAGDLERAAQGAVGGEAVALVEATPRRRSRR